MRMALDALLTCVRRSALALRGGWLRPAEPFTCPRDQPRGLQITPSENYTKASFDKGGANPVGESDDEDDDDEHSLVRPRSPTLKAGPSSFLFF